MSKRKLNSYIIFFSILISALLFIKLPFYLNLPGEAYELAPIVKVENGDQSIGEFMMTTVGVSNGEINLLTYLWAQVAPYNDLIPAKDMRPEGETDKEYVYRQLYMMDMSQNVAIAVAYEKAGKHIEYEYNGVFVMKIVSGMDAVNKLEVGDRIYQVNGSELKSSEQFIESVANLNEGDEIELSIDRNGELLIEKVKLTPFPENKTKYGVGISLVTDRKIMVDPKINIESATIGGPSAGLMFTLEILNQLTSGDLTSGYKIAGTGTMTYEGNVGPIGGITYKIVAADRAGADYFLAPSANSNYLDAQKAALELGTDMRVIPIDTIEDAIQFLQTLQ